MFTFGDVYVVHVLQRHMANVDSAQEGFYRVLSTKRSINLRDLYKITENQEDVRRWLINEGLLGDFGGVCEKCQQGTLSLIKDSSKTDKYVWRCGRKCCHRKISLRHGSWFEGSHLTLSQIVLLSYFWIYDYPQEIVRHEIDIGSSHTTVDWYNFCREICEKIVEKDNKKIGGPGFTVEIDESKFGKRKYHRGRKVDGAWVFGGICRETKECFLEVVEDRSANTLIPILCKYVQPGTLVLSDCWKSYSKLSEEGYIHRTVNHSIEFVNSEDGTHTNTIESTWRAVKTSLPKSGTQKELYTSYFAVYCVKQKYFTKGDKSDYFRVFLDLLKRVHQLPKADKTPRKTPKKREASTQTETEHCLKVAKCLFNVSSESADDFE